MELTQGSETSANYNLTPGKYPKEYIQYSNHGESLKSRTNTLYIQSKQKCCVGHTQESTSFISNERYTHSLVNVRMQSNQQKNVGRPRRRTDQHRRRWNTPGMAYTLRDDVGDNDVFVHENDVTACYTL